ncbi:MAG: cell wall hydrolase [Rhizobiaceae bacterium]|nr:cell wall hydrolase [Rhizobiaceae bacterium]
MRTSYKKSVLWPNRLQQRLAKFVFPLIAAGGMFLGFPDVVAFQDVASRNATTSNDRWLAHVQEAPGQTILASVSMMGFAHKDDATLKFLTVGFKDANSRVSGSAKTATFKQPVRLGVKTKKLPQKINRSLKGDRIVSATLKKPPAHFSAGSILQRRSMLESLNRSSKLELAFVKPKSHKEVLRVASAFHSSKPKSLAIDPKLPVMVANLVKESESSVFAYATEPKFERSPFAAVLKRIVPLAVVPRLGSEDHAWAASLLPKGAYSKRQQKCLAEGIYFEARGEPVRGQAAVAQVILNRVKNPAYPSSICGVVYQNKNWRNRCQFSFACDRIRDRVRNKRLWNVAEHIATETSAGRIWFPQVGSSTHYHATYVKPKWAKRMKKVGRIGLHIFYRTKNGGWS